MPDAFPSSAASISSPRRSGVLFCLGADPPCRGGLQQERRALQRLVVSLLPAGRAILARGNIKYRILDATTAPVQADMVRRFGDTAVPRTIIGGALVEGVDEARIKQLCR